MLSMLASTIKAYTSAGGLLMAEVQEENVKNEMFFRQVENWRNVEQNYIVKVCEIASNLRDKKHRLVLKEHLKDTETESVQDAMEKNEIRPFCASLQFSKILQIVADSHKSFLSKINFDVFLVNYETSQRLIEVSKKLLEEEKQMQKQISQKRELIEKVFGRRQKLKRQKEEEEMLQIFMCDSMDITIDQKMRKKSKIKEVEKEITEYDIKVKEIIEEYRKLYENEKNHLVKIKQNCKDQTRGKKETLLKIQLHLSTFWKNLTVEVEQLTGAQNENAPCYHQYLFGRLEKKEDEVIRRLGLGRAGFVENSLRLINENLIEELTEYTKDREVKGKIKRMMETNDVNPAQTDETCRQVKLIKKLFAMEAVDCECVNMFRAIINKSCKLRLNFVFVLQFFRINNQFQISNSQIYSLFCLISEFLESCYENRDSFALKQLMILLMTYYVNHPTSNGQVSKIYIIHFFKRNPLWRDMEYWQSILVQCIFLQKKNTLKMMIMSEYGNINRKKELFEAERSAILNQMLIVVRNMIIFEFSQKEVKSFSGRFIKLLKQDPKFQKDVNSTIEQAVKQQTKLLLQQKEEIKDFYKLNFIRQKQEQYTVPVNVRRSYIE